MDNAFFLLSFLRLFKTSRIYTSIEKGIRVGCLLSAYMTKYPMRLSPSTNWNPVELSVKLRLM
jgi:hypothetical protein